ncbi:hypothetical protein PPYR_11380 [Photinus pyralis]|uniref:E3 ubiquitin-protein ligase MARCHF5 n=1 Tax=Photinus pyralis TaxID=7054 RepID=A0A5N4AB55_PHOPY|nr:hypothetical protein PPYR_11380 [Photinus pyralis]
MTSTSSTDSDPETYPLVSKESRYCWVCFATEEDDLEASWVQPCNCRGTTKWVHQACIQRWVDEKQKGSNSGRVTCPQCQTEYIIVFPNMGLWLLCWILSTTLYIKDALSLQLVVGQKEGLAVMEQSDPLVLLIGLPAIPIALIVGKLIRWEDAVLNFMRKYVARIPLVKNILPFRLDVVPNVTRTDNDIPPLSDPVSATRVLCGALLMPTIANIFGKFFFDTIKSNFHRTVLGGLAFIGIKGCLKIYHKQQQYIRQCQRKILDYTATNISNFMHGSDRRN